LKKILFILPDLNQGGAERIVTTLLNHLDKNIFYLQLILMRKEGYYLNFIPNEVQIIDLKINKIRNSLVPILFQIKKQKPDIVFCGYGEVNAFLSPFIKLFPKTKFIARETNVVSKHVVRKEIKFFYKFYNNFHAIIAQSEDMKMDLIQNFNIKEDKITLINNPVDFDFINNQLKNQNIPHEFQISNSKKVVAIGNLTHRKGFDNLLQVFSHLQHQNIELFIIGAGRDKEQLLHLKEKLNLQKVHFLGKKDNPFPYLKFADLFILASRYEGFPNVLLEAGACGIYSLANNCPGGINEIIQTKINGEVSNIENYTEFSEKIVDVLVEKKSSENITHSIKSRYSKDIILKKYNNIFVKILK